MYVSTNAVAQTYRFDRQILQSPGRPIDRKRGVFEAALQSQNFQTLLRDSSTVSMTTSGTGRSGSDAATLCRNSTGSASGPDGFIGFVAIASTRRGRTTWMRPRPFSQAL